MKVQGIPWQNALKIHRIAPWYEAPEGWTPDNSKVGIWEYGVFNQRDGRMRLLCDSPWSLSIGVGSLDHEEIITCTGYPGTDLWWMMRKYSGS